MSEPQSPREPSRLDDPREISKWARIYAQNRSLPFIVSMLIFLVLSAAIGGPSYLAGYAYLKGYTVLLAACLGVLVLAIAALIYISIPWWGGKRLEQMTARLYTKEGTVTLAPQGRGSQRRGMALGLGFAACIIASVILSMLGYIPDEFMQPVSALYVVPFLVILGLSMRPAGWLVTLIWPALYALHAIAVVAGAPIQFTGEWEPLNMLIPIAGYGLLAGIIGHVYSRFALRRLKRLARMDLPAAGEQAGARRS